MKAKVIKGLALMFTLAILVFNVAVISTKDNNVILNLKNMESKAECVSGEGLSGYIGLMKNALCYYGDLGSGHFVNGCTDADETCTL